jgi:tRNA(Ile)-lysidine synthase
MDSEIDPQQTVSAQQAVRRAVRKHLAELPAGALVLIACSGGPDSLALAKAVAAESKRTDATWSAGAIVVDHGLQVDSAAVAERAAQHCRSFGLDPVEVIRVDIALDHTGGGGPEAMARDARREALLEAADRHAAAAICLAHTRDDQAETVLLRLSRGSGARSLSAMAPVTGIWHRPLLALDRATVHASLGDLVPWVDPHNTDPRFARVRVRIDALPALVDALGSGVVHGLARSAELLRDDADALDAIADQMWLSSLIASGENLTGAIELDVSPLIDAHRAVRTRVLRRACLEVGAPAAAITFDHVRSIEALISDWRGQGPLDLPGSLRVSRACGRLRFDRSDPLGSTPRA